MTGQSVKNNPVKERANTEKYVYRKLIKVLYFSCCFLAKISLMRGIKMLNRGVIMIVGMVWSDR